jgi:hypothetical protein
MFRRTLPAAIQLSFYGLLALGLMGCGGSSPSSNSSSSTSTSGPPPAGPTDPQPSPSFTVLRATGQADDSDRFGQFDLTWTPSSTPNLDGYRLRVHIGSGPDLDLTASGLIPADQKTATIDLLKAIPDLPEYQEAWFTLFAVKGGRTSAGTVCPQGTGMAPPTDLWISNQEAGPGTLTLHWTNHSLIAKQITIHRYGALGTGDSASRYITLPANATSYTDTGLAFDVYRYYMWASVSNSDGGGMSTWVSGEPLLTETSIPMTATPLRFPVGVTLRRPDKSWDTLSDVTSGGITTLSVFHKRQPAGVWDGTPWTPDETLTSSNGYYGSTFNLDGQGNPHVFYQNANRFGQLLTQHLHLDPTQGWGVETLPDAVTGPWMLIGQDQPLPTAMAADGSCRLFVGYPDTQPFVVHFCLMSNSGGIWRTSEVAKVMGGALNDPKLFLGLENRALIISYHVDNSVTLWKEMPDGSWESHLAPFHPYRPTGKWFVGCFQLVNGDIEIYYLAPGSKGTDLLRVLFSGDTFSVPETVFSNVDKPQITLNANRDRVLLTMEQDGQAMLYIRDFNGWKSLSVGSSDNNSFGLLPRQGFSADGKFYFVVDYPGICYEEK